MKILYYLTAHGYGHAVRTAAICNELSENVRLIFRTTLPETFFREEVKRPFEIFPAQFDCGCIQRDSVTVEKKETLLAYLRLAEQNAAGSRRSQAYTWPAIWRCSFIKPLKA